MKKKLSKGNTPREIWQNVAGEYMLHFTLAGENIRGAIISGTQMIREMRANHELGILETLTLGHAYLGALLMTTQLKGRERLALKIECSGPIQGLEVEANAFGEVRGYLKKVPIPVEKPPEDFNLSPFFGAGFLSVTKFLENAKHPYTGQVILKYGSIAKDLAWYFLQSEQIPSAFHLSIQFDTSGEVAGAGGLMLQVLPGANAQTVAEMEKKVAEMPSLGRLFAEGNDAEAFLKEYFEAYFPKVLKKKKTAFMVKSSI